MFPLSETAVAAGIYAITLALGLVLIRALMKRSMRWAVGLVAMGTAALWVLIISEGDIFREVSLRHQAIIVGVALSPLLALGWSVAVNRMTRRTGPGLLLLLALPVAVAGVFIERQIVPNATCSQSHVPVRLNDTDIRLPIELSADLRLVGDRGFVRYESGNRYKEDLRKLCDLTERGVQVLEVDMIWMAPAVRLWESDVFCDGDTATDLCAVFEDLSFSRVGAIKIMSRDETSVRYELSHAGQGPEDGILFEGDAQAGFVCNVARDTHRAGLCRIWRSLEADTVVKIVSSDTRGVEDHDELLGQLNKVLDEVLAVLQPEP